MTPQTITISINGCSRCGADGHESLTFTPLDNPIEIPGETTLTHWSLCPVNRQPILLGFGPRQSLADTEAILHYEGDWSEPGRIERFLLRLFGCKR